MADYDGADDYQDRWRNTRDSERPPPPYPAPSNMDYDQRGRGPAQYPPYGENGGMPPPPAGGPPGTEVPPPPIGERRPSALKRPGSRSRVPNSRPEFQDDLSYVGSTAPDLEAKNRKHHRQFRDKRDGYESDEGEMHRKMRSRGDYDEPEPRRRGARDQYDDRGAPPPRNRGYDDEPEPRHRSRKDRDRDYDRGYDDDPPARHKRRDQPGVEYGADPIPAVRRSQTDRSGRRQKPRKDDYDDESSEDDRRRQPPSRRRSQDDSHRRRRDYDDDRDDNRDDRRRRDGRDDRNRDRDRDDRDRRRDKSRDRRSRYSDDESDYGGRRDRDRRRGSSAPPKEVKIGDYDIGPLLAKGKKHYGTLAPVLAPLAMNMARKYMSDRKR